MCVPLLAYAGAREQVTELLAGDEPPGVVFEIVTGQDDGLTWALPLARDLTARLRARFPALPVAVVTHGSEMFALQSSQAGRFAPVHELAGILGAEQVEVHVCGTFAEHRGVAPEAFPASIDVAAEGPAQTQGYRELGWPVVLIGSREAPAQ